MTVLKVKGKTFSTVRSILLAFLILFPSGIYVVASLVTTPHKIPASGGIILSGNASFGLSWNAEGTEEVLTFDFGDMPPGTAKSFEFYIINAGEAMTANLYWTDATWTSKPSDISLTWDLGSNVIPAHSVQFVTMTLIVNIQVPGTQPNSFSIHIDGNLVKTSV